MREREKRGEERQEGVNKERGEKMCMCECVLEAKGDGGKRNSKSPSKAIGIQIQCPNT